MHAHHQSLVNHISNCSSRRSVIWGVSIKFVINISRNSTFIPVYSCTRHPSTSQIGLEFQSITAAAFIRPAVYSTSDGLNCMNRTQGGACWTLNTTVAVLLLYYTQMKCRNQQA